MKDGGFVHVMPRELFFKRMKFRIRFRLRSNFLVQWGIKRTFKMLYKLGNFLDDSSKKFDEDSSTSARLRSRRDKVRRLQQRIGRHSMVWLDEEERGGLLRNIDAGKGHYGKFKQQLKQAYTAFTKKKQKVKEDPFAKWDKSDEKVEINVNWFSGEADSKEIKLGVLMMDIDAPGGVAREYCRRFLRKELNKKCGENFLLVGRGEGVPLAEESSKRIGQLAPQKFNNKTKEVEHVLQLCKNPSEALKKKDIPVIKSDARIREDKEKMDKYLESLLMEEKDKEKKDVTIPEEWKKELTEQMIKSGIKQGKIDNMFNRKGKLIGSEFNNLTRDLEVATRDLLKKVVDEAMGVEHYELEVDLTEEVQEVELSEEARFELEAKMAREKELKEQEAEKKKLEKKAGMIAAAAEEEAQAQKELELQVELALQKELEEASTNSSPKKSILLEGGEDGEGGEGSGKKLESAVELTADDDDRWEEAEEKADGR